MEIGNHMIWNWIRIRISNSSNMESDDYFKLCDREDSANQSEENDVIRPRYMGRPQELKMERTRRSESEMKDQGDGVSVWTRPTGGVKAKRNARSRLGNEQQTEGRFALLGDGN